MKAIKDSSSINLSLGHTVSNNESDILIKYPYFECCQGAEIGIAWGTMMGKTRWNGWGDSHRMEWVLKVEKHRWSMTGNGSESRWLDPRDQDLREISIVEWATKYGALVQAETAEQERSLSKTPMTPLSTVHVNPLDEDNWKHGLPGLCPMGLLSLLIFICIL